ncbi:MAG: thiol reductant ABC exporter subunit CydD [Pelovirga sp.]
MPPSPALTWLTALRPHCRRQIRLTLLIGTTAALCIIVQAGLLAHIIHAAFIDDIRRAELHFPFLLLAAVIVLRALLAWGREVCGQQASTLVRRRVREQLLERLGSLGPVRVKDRQTAALVSTLLERVEALHGYFAHYLTQKHLALIVPAMIGLSAFFFSWTVGLIFLLTAPLIPLFMIMIGRGAEKLSQNNFQLLARMSAHFLDTLQGLATLKLFHRSAQEAQQIGASSEGYRKGTMAVLRVAFLSSAVLEFLTSVAIAMTAVYLGLTYLNFLDFGLYERELSLRTGLFLLLLAPEFYLPLRELGTHYHARAEALGAAAEISSLLADRPGETQGKRATDQVSAVDGISLEVRHVHHRFDRGHRIALDNLSLQIRAGEWIAIVGASGAGKTTLLNLLLGFLPLQQGEILINGRSFADLDREHWYRHLAWVPQHPTLFHGSLKNNIAMGNTLAAEQIAAAAKAARIDDLADGQGALLAREVGEEGNQLSGGQARRVALARAFAKDAPLILLDEPTAGLDQENERLILDSLQQLRRGKTLIMLTHRLDSARAADRIIVMAAGRVIEQGCHSELLAAGGVYADLLRSGQQVLA